VFAAVLAGAGAGLVAVSPPRRASLYSPDEPLASLPVGPDGRGQAVPFDEFKRRLTVLKNQLNPELKGNKDREAVLKRIDARKAARTRPPAETVALAVDLLRAGRADEAAGVLAAERGGFLPNVTLAHVRAAAGDERGWAAAAEHLAIANEERPPADLPGLTPAQFAWQQGINRGPLARLFESRWQEARRRPDPAAEQPDPIFPVRFVNPAGEYEPGVLAPEEAAKLPPDAVATVQQLLLWFPTDARLYWLLAELYAATGQLDVAGKMFDELVDAGWKYGNRKLLQEHRAAVRAALAARPPTAAPADDPLFPADAGPGPPADQPGDAPPPISMRTVLIYFGVVAAVGLLALVRALTRRRRAA
jgi:hypothetical protein